MEFYYACYPSATRSGVTKDGARALQVASTWLDLLNLSSALMSVMAAVPVKSIAMLKSQAESK